MYGTAEGLLPLRAKPGTHHERPKFFHHYNRAHERDDGPSGRSTAPMQRSTTKSYAPVLNLIGHTTANELSECEYTVNSASATDPSGDPSALE